MKPAGVDKSKGVIAATFIKDVNDPRWRDDPGVKEWSAFAPNTVSQTEYIDYNAAYGYGAAGAVLQVLKQCGDDLSRENIMKQAINLKDLELPLLLPGIQGQHLADQLQPDPSDAASQVQRRELGAVRGRADGLSD